MWRWFVRFLNLDDDGFGARDPRAMPPHFFLGALELDYDSAVKADTRKQNTTVTPRYWYIDAKVRCERCGAIFTFSAREQQAWYEEYGFYVDSFPKHCLDCRRLLREVKALRQAYDRSIAQALQSDSLEEKRRVAEVIDRFEALGERLPDKMIEQRRALARQVERLADD